MDLEHCFNVSHRENFEQPLVLAVDDNEDNLQLIAQLLELTDCSVMTATTGETTILKAKTHQPDLILLDMMLPDLSGIEVTLRLKQDPQTMTIPIVAVTAMAREEDQLRFILSGCADCVTKPYNIEDLEAIIRRYVFQGNLG